MGWSTRTAVAVTGTGPKAGHLHALGALMFACGLSACSSSAQPAVDLPHFQDLSSAPPAIAHSARAVVRIGTATASGTGSFISSSGLLLTNNHVLGAPVCPLEGCAVWLSIGHQRGEAPRDPVLAFAVPQAVDLGLDIATLQVYQEQGGPMFPSPDFLNFVSRSAVDLLGTHVFVVGHPEASLKRWTDGTVVDTDGEWFKSTAFALPGDSGSPTLDDQGNIVGLVHRGSTGEDLITSDGVNVYSLGTPSAAVLAVASAPLPSGMLSITASTTAVNVLDNNQVFLNGEAPNALVGGKQTSVLSVLAQACDAALGRTDFVSIDDLQAAQAPCFDAMNWLECRTDLPQSSPGSVCADAASWAARFQRVSDTARALNGQVSLNAVSFVIAGLSSTRDAGKAAGGASLSAALAEAQTPLDLLLTPYLAAFGIERYAGVSVATYVRGYRQVAHYELAASNLANAAGWLYDNGAFTKAELEQMLSDLGNDPNVSLGSKLLVEELRYNFGFLD
jgi:Trypsin-like peptidase domain